MPGLVDTYRALLYKLSMKLLISADEIADRVDVLAKEISREYESKKLHIIVILKGAFIFTADLIRKLTIPFDIDFIRISTYGNNHIPDIKPSTTLEHNIVVENKDVLIIDDILDTGNTLTSLAELSKHYGSKSVKICTLLNKPSRRQFNINLSFCGFDIDDGFVVGYGLDYAEKYRGLPNIYVLDEEEIKRG
jgi:hypoxanthine phosphoribosyltransferase